MPKRKEPVPSPKANKKRPKIAQPSKGSGKGTHPPGSSQGQRGTRAEVSKHYEKTTDPGQVTRPVTSIVHQNLVRAWKVNNASNEMCFIFDAVSPARQFERNTEYSDTAEFPEYGPEPWEDLTETDGSGPGLMPFKPIEHSKQKYQFECSIWFRTFMHWAEGEVRTITVRSTKKLRGKRAWVPQRKEYKVPAAYHRIACQLVAEDQLGDKITCHEAVRRQSYARRTLDAFGDELKASKVDPINFRSKVLTPILQRQLAGVHDAYTPSVRSAVANNEDTEVQPTILDATEFYLSEDPTEPCCAANYRRNIIYIPEARWHLGLVMGKDTEGAEKHWKRVLKNHDRIMDAMLCEDSDEESDDDETLGSFLNQVEVEVIFEEGLEDFFRHELNEVPELVEEVRHRQQKRRQQKQHEGSDVEEGSDGDNATGDNDGDGQSTGDGAGGGQPTGDGLV